MPNENKNFYKMECLFPLKQGEPPINVLVTANEDPDSASHVLATNLIVSLKSRGFTDQDILDWLRDDNDQLKVFWKNEDGGVEQLPYYDYLILYQLFVLFGVVKEEKPRQTPDDVAPILSPYARDY